MNGLPKIGYVRQAEILAVFPVSASTWKRGVESGIYPRKYNLSARTVAWKAQDIHLLLESIDPQ